MPRIDGTELLHLPLTSLLAGFAMALMLAAILTRWVIACGPVDQPRQRGAHANPTPTSGGMAVMAACALGAGIALLFTHHPLSGVQKPAALLFLFSAAMGLSGAVDDVLGLPAKLRLGFQVVCALAFAAAVPVKVLDFGFGLSIELWWPIGVAGTALWLIIVVNAINFVDGVNGLAPGVQAICLALLSALILWLTPAFYAVGIAGFLLLLLCGLGANLGLLPFNLPMGKVFQGDSGSLFSAALIGGAVPALHSLGYGSIWLGGYILAPVLVEIVLTLFIRWRAGEKLFEAHKRHLYQQWLIRRKSSHARVSMSMWALSLISGGLGLLMEYIYLSKGVDLRFAELVILLAALSLLWLRLRRHIGADEKEATPPPPDAT